MNVHNLSLELLCHPDTPFVEYVVNGFTDGFNPMISDLPLDNLERKNNLSARQNPDVVDAAVKLEVANGYVCGPFSTPLFPVVRINPLGLAVGKYSGKQRLILDLSAPHNDSHYSINELIDKESCSLSYVSIDNAIRIILHLGQNALMCKADISDAFKVPLHNDFWPFFGFKWRNAYYFYKRLAFGCRSSPKIFDHLSQAICWILKTNYGVKHILHLLDDFLTIDKSDYPAQSTMASLLRLFHQLNIPLSAKKTMGPTTRLEYLGIILDSSTMTAFLPPDKVRRISMVIDSFLDRQKCTKRELLSLLGHLNYASRVIPPGRAFVSYLITLSTTVSQLHHHLSLSAACRTDLRMWKQFLQQWNGVYFFHDTKITEAHDIELFTDAAASVGFGGFYQGHWFAELWPQDIQASPALMKSSAFLELYAINVAAFVWGKQWCTKKILFRCDNLAVVQIINKGRAKDKNLMALMRKLTLMSAVDNYVILAKHVPGICNEVADCLSRFQFQRFRRLAPHADLRATQCPNSSELMWS